MTMKLQPTGIWAWLDDRIGAFDGRAPSAPGRTTAGDCARFAAWVERLGYGALWIPEASGRNALVQSSWLLANTKTLIVATGIANIYARDPIAMYSAQQGLSEQSGGRFLLGVGVSHPEMVGPQRGHTYGKPLQTMRDYLTAMRQAPYLARLPETKPPVVVAALRSKMMALAGELADGAHPLNVTPDLVARARGILGPGKLLCVEQKLILETDAARARSLGRGALANYLQLTNYRAAWKEMGFDDSDFANGGSDLLVDSLIAWGDEAALRRRIREHLDAGADHVCVSPLSAEGVDMRLIELLAPRDG
jgi:probable F420-dependent oxidoreductase